MEYNLTFPAFVGGLILVAWFFIQRSIRIKDEDQKEKDGECKKRMDEHGIRMGQMNDHIQLLELALADKVNREELSKLYDKMDGFRSEWKADMKDLRLDLLQAIRGRNNAD